MKTSYILTLLLSLSLASCSLIDSDDDRPEAIFSIQSGLISQHNFRLHLSDWKSTTEIGNEDFQGENELSTSGIKTAASGKLLIEFELVDSSTAETISSGDLELELKEDWGYKISFRADSAEADPTKGCFGCMGYKSYAIDYESPGSASASQMDSLYVVWGGNYLSDPVDY